ncbi:hypothetical protein E5F05_02050 (plasmid) [Deinococcus metallilatus]|uniref:Uncharacterized protein n=1 Tax=Deinococcus metallilatus TaxID=1211322 RepID=A0ABR6MV82_9DEIO|nr:hypothetical protein [Deinococcus metallilatus]MBB5295821.1 hypothetical protein [Deinococcus metallilatus]QBY06752.1 hypothetical protein E5F05_02050 [Deinococcus metallilatus]
MTADDAQALVARFVDALISASAGKNVGQGSAQDLPVRLPPFNAAALETARRLILFAYGVHQSGFAAAAAPFRKDLGQHPARRDVLLALLNGLGPEGSTLPEVDARFALLHILEVGQAQDTVEAYEAHLVTALDPAALGERLRDLFAACLEHALQRFMYEYLTERTGHDQAMAALIGASKGLWQRVSNLPPPAEPAGGWHSQEGLRAVEALFADVIRRAGPRT